MVTVKHIALVVVTAVATMLGTYYAVQMDIEINKNVDLPMIHEMDALTREVRQLRRDFERADKDYQRGIDQLKDIQWSIVREIDPACIDHSKMIVRGPAPKAEKEDRPWWTVFEIFDRVKAIEAVVQDRNLNIYATTVEDYLPKFASCELKRDHFGEY